MIERILTFYTRFVLLFFTAVFPYLIKVETTQAASRVSATNLHYPSGTGDCYDLMDFPCIEVQSTSQDSPLPDLQTLPPFDLRLVVSRSSGTRLLRFSNSVANTGEVAVELRGDLDPKDNSIEVSQHIAGSDEDVEKHRVGEFIYQPDHGHYHWKGFSLYQIWSVRPGGYLEEMVLSSDKVGFCLVDSSRADEEWLQANTSGDVEISQRGAYGECTWQRQGISVGWVDTYLYNIPGQSINVSDLPNGIYALRSTVNPDGIIHEMDRSNNSAVAFFSLNDERLTVHGEQYPKAPYPELKAWTKEKIKPPDYPIQK